MKRTVSSSFRDPSGSLFFIDDSIYRRINPSYKQNYELLLSSGLYKDLLDSGLLVPHEEVDVDCELASGAYKVIKPTMIPFVSYPYEWSFSQLKAAALATLEIQKRALKHGMSLKDASAYNIQFLESRPVLIDTLSFEEYDEGRPWVAYKQFCQHFLSPLVLMSVKDVRLNQLLRVYIDGVPLDLASSLLPLRTKLSFSLLMHIHLHAKSQKRYEDETINVSECKSKMSQRSMLGLIDNLESCVKGLDWKPQGTEWVDYYQDDSYTEEALEDKKHTVSRFLDIAKPATVWDLGANTGVYSRIACERGALTTSFDVDPACIDLNYRKAAEHGETRLLPLILDLTNPSPGIGWAHDERMSVRDRGPVDTVMALALIHHLVISNNVPFDRVAGFFSEICSWLIIEFVPKDDPKVKKLLATREDIFPNYTQEDFEREFSKFFEIRESKRIDDSLRTLYIMERRS